MMDVRAEVSIEFYNKTASAHRVIVFARNGSPVPPRKANPFVVWRVLHGLGTSKFVYPAGFGVGISWRDPRHHALPQQAGPFAAKPGSIWEIVQDSENRRVPLFCQISVDDSAGYTVKVHSSAPPGLAINCNLYKAGLVFITHTDLSVGYTTELLVNGMLHFGLAPDTFECREGETFSEEELSTVSALKTVSLKEYPNGLKVALCQDVTTRAYRFQVSHME